MQESNQSGTMILLDNWASDRPSTSAGGGNVRSRRSPVFRKMFSTKMLEEETGLVRSDDCTLQVMRAVIKFC